MSEDVDGRQTRPANDVGRPNRSAERPSLDGRWPSTTVYRSAKKKCPYAVFVGRPTPPEAIWPYCACGFRPPTEWREVCEGLRGSEAPHGETPQDAEA